MRTQRQVVDYSLQKRALLRDVHNGRVGTLEVCDASPYLKNAARFHGEPTEERCPVCRRDNLTLVHYIYGDELKQSAGQARKLAELPVLAMTLREFQVFVVEVCQSAARWNHLIEQYLLGRDALMPTDGPEQGCGGGRHGRHAGAGERRNGERWLIGRPRVSYDTTPDRRASSAALARLMLTLQGGCRPRSPASWRCVNSGNPFVAPLACHRDR